jgi:2-polyprenyl-3-methyl-5-hydroxy-6-metoxy-1,4-benzoquinol methylase
MVGSGSHFDKAAGDWDNEPRRVALMKAIGEAILREARPTQEMDVLDYGCGTGLIGLFLLPHVRTVTGADNSLGMLEVLRDKITAGGFENMKAFELDLEQDLLHSTRYDMIVVGMVMHHIKDTEKVLRAFHDLLVPGGTLCLADLDTEPGTFHPANMDDIVHHHGFNRERLERQLADVGFSQMRDTTALKFSKPVDGQDPQEFSVFLITGKK